VCTQSARQKKPVELADIFSQYADTYVAQHGASSIQYKAIHAITNCRTAALGGHTSRCNHCGALEISYNSCRYRHCPKCQKTKQMRWSEARKAELLPVPYFHVVFTLPHELNAIASYNPVLIYSLLFQAAWATVSTLGHDKKRLNGQMGMLAFLHTWGQNLSQHIHLHCMIPAGAIRVVDGEPEWKASKEDYLFPVKVMGKLFGKLLLTKLVNAFNAHEILFKGAIMPLSDQQQFMKFSAQLRKKSWNVYAKEPFNGAEGGVEYLARYFTKTAIGNERILSCDNQQVTFKWRDYSDNNKTKVMRLDAHEFIRRYLSHILPSGFMRVRYFGFMSSAVKAKNTKLIKSLLLPEERPASNISSILGVSSAMHGVLHTLNIISTESMNLEPRVSKMVKLETEKEVHFQSNKTRGSNESTVELMKRVVGIDIELCKRCRIGRLEKIEVILPHALQKQSAWDTS
jgi:hypothetical protein